MVERISDKVPHYSFTHSSACDIMQSEAFLLLQWLLSCSRDVFETEIAVTNLRMFFIGNNSIGALHEQRLNVASGFGNPDNFFIHCTFIVGWYKTCSWVQVFHQWKCLYIGTNLINNSNGGENVADTRSVFENVKFLLIGEASARMSSSRSVFWELRSL